MANNDIKNKAVDLLARREHSRYELFSKLDMKGFDKKDINPVLDELESQNFLSDQRFGALYLESKSARGYGPVRIRQELRDRGIAEDLITLLLEKNSDIWPTIAKEVRVKKFGASIPEDFKDKATQMRFLQYRGFTTDQINQAF